MDASSVPEHTVALPSQVEMLHSTVPTAPLFPDQRVLLLNPRVVACWNEERPRVPQSVYVKVVADSVVRDADYAISDPIWTLTAEEIHVTVDSWLTDPANVIQHRRWNTQAKMRAQVESRIDDMNDYLYDARSRGAPPGTTVPLRCDVRYWERGRTLGAEVYSEWWHPEIYVLKHTVAPEVSGQPYSNVHSVPLPDFLQRVSSQFQVLPLRGAGKREMIQDIYAHPWHPLFHLSLYGSITRRYRAIHF